MEVTVQAKDLAASLFGPVHVANTAATQQATGGVLIHARDNDWLTLAASDGTTHIVVAAKYDTMDEKGMVLVSARRFYDIIRALDGTVELKTQGDRLSIRSGKFHGALAVLPAGNFPSMPSVEDRDISIPPEFARAVSQVTRAAAPRDEARKELTGVLVDAQEGRLTLMATDGVRAARRELVTSGAPELTRSQLVPAFVLQEAVRLEATTIKLDDLHTEFAGSGFKIVTTAMQGTLPPVEKFINGPFAHNFTVNRGELIDGIRRVNLVADDFAPLRIEVKNDLLHVRVKSETIGAAQEQVHMSASTVEEFTAAFKAQLLLDGLEAVHSENAVIAVNEALKPVLISGEDESYVYLLMPAKLNEVKK